MPSPGAVLRLSLPLACLHLLPAPSVLEAQVDGPSLSTFSIVACDPHEGFLGIGIQSRVVGAGSIVPAAEAGVGAIATQAAANVGYKEEGLDLLRQGRSPQEVVAHFVATDAGSENRQVAVMDASCRLAVHTGESTIAWAGHRVGERYAVLGNILTGPEVLEAMARAFEGAERAGRPFGERILESLKAGQEAGGDRRGRQGAGLLIVKEGAGYGGGDDRYADLRVEDHVEPILELERVYGVWMSVFQPQDYWLPGGTRELRAPQGAHVCRLAELLARAGHGEGAGDRRSCALDETVLPALKAFQAEVGLPVRPVVDAQLVRRLREVVGEEPRSP